jgi:hypothetical protein
MKSDCPVLQFRVNKYTCAVQYIRSRYPDRAEQNNYTAKILNNYRLISQTILSGQYFKIEDPCIFTYINTGEDFNDPNYNEFEKLEEFLKNVRFVFPLNSRIEHYTTLNCVGVKCIYTYERLFGEQSFGSISNITGFSPVQSDLISNSGSSDYKIDINSIEDDQKIKNFLGYNIDEHFKHNYDPIPIKNDNEIISIMNMINIEEDVDINCTGEHRFFEFRINTGCGTSKFDQSVVGNTINPQDGKTKDATLKFSTLERIGATCIVPETEQALKEHVKRLVATAACHIRGDIFKANRADTDAVVSGVK